MTKVTRIRIDSPRKIASGKIGRAAGKPFLLMILSFTQGRVGNGSKNKSSEIPASRRPATDRNRDLSVKIHKRADRILLQAIFRANARGFPPEVVHFSIAETESMEKLRFNVFRMRGRESCHQFRINREN
jgi:hypothetical protein